MKESPELVSIIVPCFNYGEFLSEALHSVLVQTYDYWECWVIDDGSTDNTRSVAKVFCDRDARFKYLHQNNKGHSAARNFGIENSSGSLILPLDADDLININFLESAVSEMLNNPDVKLVTGQVQYFGEVDDMLIIPPFDLKNFLTINYISITSLFRKKDFNDTTGFDESMLGFEDWDFFIQLLKDGGAVSILPIVSLYYRKKDNSVFKNVVKDKKRTFTDLLRVYTKNADVYERYFLSPIQLIQENEKLNRIIRGYHLSKTYRFGLQFQKLKNLFKGR